MKHMNHAIFQHKVVLPICLSTWILLMAGCAGGPERPAAIPQESGRAVHTLLAKADNLQAQQQWERAAALLERALRIEPRNAQLWHRLARVRLNQGRYGMAQSLAQKSNALAGDDAELQAQNALIIELAQRGR
jgi:cytochrome c-type biogenesis protein CcmH/NrfG